MTPKKIVIMLFTIILILTLSGCQEKVKKENSNDDDWLSDYFPVHSIGSGTDDFWIVYPDNHANSIIVTRAKYFTGRGCTIFGRNYLLPCN